MPLDQRVQRFFDAQVPYHEALVHEGRDLRPHLYDGARKGRIPAGKLRELGKNIAEALDRKTIVSNRISVGLKLAHTHLEAKNYPAAMDELNTTFYWSDPTKLRSLAPALQRMGHGITFERELPASFGHVIKGKYNGRDAIFKITPNSRPTDPSVKIANLLSGLPVARQLKELTTPLQPSRLEVFEHLTGKQAGVAVTEKHEAKKVYRSMGRVLARLHTHRITPEIDRRITNRARTWRTVTEGVVRTVDPLGRELGLSPAQINLVKIALKKPVQEPDKLTLIHNDFHEENILIGEDSSVSGLIDFSPKKGDPMYDLAKGIWYARRAREMYGERFKDNDVWLKEGYKAVRELTPQEKKRLRYFLLFISVKFAKSQMKFAERRPILKKLILESLQAVQREP